MIPSFLPPPPLVLFGLQDSVYHFTQDTLPLPPPAQSRGFSWAIFEILIFRSPSPLSPLITFWVLFGLLE